MNLVLEIDAGAWGTVHIDFSDEQSHVMMHPHTHDTWEVFCWLGSRMTYYLGDDALRVPHAAVVPVPPGTAHRTQYGHGELRWKLDIRFEEKFFGIFPSDEVRSQVRAALEGGMIAVPVKWANELRQTVIGALMPAAEGGALASARAAFAAASILSGIAAAANEHERDSGAVGARYTHVAAAMAIIDRDYASDISLRSLADELHLTETYICHIFRDVLGATVSECIRRRRVEAACPMLLDTSVSVADAAERVGFGSVNYFTKCFRLFQGVTPSRYRAIVLGGKRHRI